MPLSNSDIVNVADDLYDRMVARGDDDGRIVRALLHLYHRTATELQQQRDRADVNFELLQKERERAAELKAHLYGTPINSHKRETELGRPPGM